MAAIAEQTVTVSLSADLKQASKKRRRRNDRLAATVRLACDDPL